ncbi:hypothetical protein Q31a_59410 [Aureliella helgolandensis]|uniref:Uncharacterized protein n=1 Tax=Aureliella helgolandensis TaxID=2527968 RepID=A0A518GG26_9BACT|nr:hypothetical protein Q31a_59410 [Aureliella helgolandensis]
MLVALNRPVAATISALLSRLAPIHNFAKAPVLCGE